MRTDSAKATRFSIIIICSLLTGFTSISLDTYLPALVNVSQTFTTSIQNAQLSLGIFLTGFAFAQLVYGPLSDRYGRRPTLLLGLSLYFVSAIVCMLAPNIYVLIVARFIQGIGACSAIVSAYSIIRDLYSGEKCTKIYAVFSITMTVIPAFMPIWGGFLVEHVGWRYIFLFLAVVAIAAIIAILTLLPETVTEKQEKKGIVISSIKNYMGLCLHKKYMAYMICSASDFVAIFCFVSISPFLMIDILHMSSFVFGLLLATNAFFLILGSYLSIILVDRLGRNGCLLLGNTLLTLGSVLMLTLALILHVSLISLLYPMYIVSVGIGMIAPASMAGALESFKDISGQANAFAGFVRFISGMIVGALLSYFFNNSIYALAIVIMVIGLINYWVLRIVYKN